MTIEVAQKILKSGMVLAGVAHMGERINISYQRNGMRSVRYADVRSWCRIRAVPEMRWDGVNSVLKFAANLQPNFAIAAGWYYMIPAVARAQFPLGVAGIHNSLLPHLRGGAPLNWALINGDSETGVTLFELGDGVDDGPIYGQCRIPISPHSTISDLVNVARVSAGELVQHCLPRIASGELQSIPQTGNATYGLQRTPEDGWIDWRGAALCIDRLIRASGRPYPGAFTHLNGVEIRVWAADRLSQVAKVYGAPGQLCRIPDQDHICVMTGDGMLALREVTSSDGRAISNELWRSSQQRLGK